MEGLNYFILDLLMNGSSSVAALYTTLSEHYPIPNTVSVNEVLDALFQIERRHWVTGKQLDTKLRAITDDDRKKARLQYSFWLDMGRNEAKDVSWDKVGLWYEITPNGKEAWEQWAADRNVTTKRKWMLDVDNSAHSITIAAENATIAENQLQEWLDDHPDFRLQSNTVRIKSRHNFTLRDGRLVTDGVKLTCKYTESKRI